ncbi:MAG: DUF3833 domain-containing protein [Betaproteobacteria bacterium]|nr:DUF3833 domain-containing protein [Betaproteobacteria bacterium]
MFQNLRRLAAVAALGTLALLAGCSSVSPAKYSQQGPKFSFRDYFDGTVDAWGMFQSRDGEVIKRFKVTLKGTWEGQNGTLDENFVYADGTTEHRIWKIRQTGPDSYTATAGDIVGEAQGEEAGPAIRYRYTMAIPVSGSTYQFQFDDWMYQIDDDVVLNRATMSKFGVQLGEVTLSFRKRR